MNCTFRRLQAKRQPGNPRRSVGRYSEVPDVCDGVQCVIWTGLLRPRSALSPTPGPEVANQRLCFSHQVGGLLPVLRVLLVYVNI